MEQFPKKMRAASVSFGGACAKARNLDYQMGAPPDGLSCDCRSSLEWPHVDSAGAKGFKKLADRAPAISPRHGQ